MLIVKVNALASDYTQIQNFALPTFEMCDLRQVTQPLWALAFSFFKWEHDYYPITRSYCYEAQLRSAGSKNISSSILVSRLCPVSGTEKDQI